ncbi:hypothetical protein JEQ12_013282 [Ovis aries]|uniref:Uncharacterized protein n=1 Tax=Ovis aries TaxID=9940 RepID=A0A836CPV5_SHEEP|nr:hypothetical protein JEQ12_013282 [Ovis aries]
MTPPIGSTAVGPGVREGGALEQAWAWAWLAALQGILPWKHHSLASTSSLSLENPFLTMPSVGTKNQSAQHCHLVAKVLSDFKELKNPVSACAEKELALSVGRHL